MNVRFLLAIAAIWGLSACAGPAAQPGESIARVSQAQLPASGEALAIEAVDESAIDPARPADNNQSDVDIVSGLVGPEPEPPPGFFAVWRHERPFLQRYDVHGSRLAVDGTVLDPGGLLIGEDVSAMRPRTCFNETEKKFLTQQQVPFLFRRMFPASLFLHKVGRLHTLSACRDL